MLVPSRRGFIIGLSSIIATPALVKASSLDAVLRSKILLDPWVLTYNYYPTIASSYAGMRSGGAAIPSEFLNGWLPNQSYSDRREQWLALSEHKKADYLNDLTERKFFEGVPVAIRKPLWAPRRMSELIYGD